MGPTLPPWPTLIHRSLQSRLSGAQFASFANLTHAKYPARGLRVAKALFHSTTPDAASFDSLILIYLSCLLKSNIIDLADVLRVLLDGSRIQHGKASITAGQSTKTSGDQPWTCPFELEETVLSRLLQLLISRQHPQSRLETLQIIRVLSEWMSTVVAASTRDEMMQDMHGHASSQVSAESLAVREAVGMLVIALAENARVVTVLQRACPKDIRKAFAHALSLYIPFLSQTSLQISNRLELIQRQQDLLDGTSTKLVDSMLATAHADGSHLPSMNGSNVVDLPLVHSRAGLYIILNAILVADPLIDDSLLLQYLQTRYKGDVSTLTIDLITASFDALSNVTFRNETKQTFVFRSFLVNKVPTLVTILATSMFPPLTPEYCITQALNHVDPQAFPSFSSMFDVPTDGDILSDVRQEFLFACCLHQLLPEESIERLLGEVPMQELPSGGRYVQEDLVDQCVADAAVVDRLIGEMEGLDGNAGAVVGAITEVIHRHCANRDTMSLKGVCLQLTKKPKSLDVMLLFRSAPNILLPVCQLLDSWKYEDDQSEHQPLYEDFGGILLLILAFVHRYDLQPVDLGIASGDSFVARLLHRGHVSQTVEEMSEDQSKHFGGWVRALFDADEGISDELISSCHPHEFYFLVPTLFRQSVLACRAKVMSVETLKGGLEYLLETFLLPSLVGAFTYLTHRLWECKGNTDILMQIVATLVKPNSISGEAESMHHTILDLVGKPLEHSLRELRRLEPARPDVDTMLVALQPHLGFKRTSASHHAELESWTATHGGGLAASLRNSFQSLVLWSQNPGLNMTPASFTFRQVLICLQILGAMRVVRTLADELKLQHQNGSGALALDIATSLICAPSLLDSIRFAPSSHISADGGLAPLPRRRGWAITLPQALRMEHEDLATTSTADALRVEAIVRLQRRVELQMSGTAPGVVATEVLNNAEAVAAVAAAVDAVDAVGVAGDVHDGLSGTDAGLGLEGSVAVPSLDMGMAGVLDEAGGLMIMGAGKSGDEMDLGMDLGGE